MLASHQRSADGESRVLDRKKLTAAFGDGMAARTVTRHGEKGPWATRSAPLALRLLQLHSGLISLAAPDPRDV